MLANGTIDLIAKTIVQRVTQKQKKKNKAVVKHQALKGKSQMKVKSPGKPDSHNVVTSPMETIAKFPEVEKIPKPSDVQALDTSDSIVSTIDGVHALGQFMIKP